MRAKLVFSTDDRHPLNDARDAIHREPTRYLWDHRLTEAFAGRSGGPDRRRFLVVRVRRVGTFGFEACDR